MASFSLVIEYLTGYAVATDPSSRQKPEWPPHPARVYMALAAAHFETDGSLEDKRAGRAHTRTRDAHSRAHRYHRVRLALALRLGVEGFLAHAQPVVPYCGISKKFAAMLQADEKKATNIAI